jgi:stearoyl-CoA desaturase (Delta-9 desaturase)
MFTLDFFENRGIGLNSPFDLPLCELQVNPYNSKEDAMSTAMEPLDKKEKRTLAHLPHKGHVDSGVSQDAPHLQPSATPRKKDLAECDDTPNSMLVQRIVMTITVVVPFLGLVAGIALAWQYGMMNGWYLGMMLGGWILTGLGITIGYHRMLTHRSFETTPLIHAFWTLMGALAIEGSPLVWVAVHRKHHQHSDLEDDPHSPHNHSGGYINWWKGFLHSHMGWLFGKVWSEKTLQQYVPDLMPQRFTVLVDKYYLWVIVATLAVPTAIAGLVTMSWTGAMLGLIWGGLARMFMTHHITWSINSICHLFGSRDFKSDDDSRNNLLFGILGHGEGWHNNHHAFPTSARHGLMWWQFDLSWIIIRSMELCGLAWNVKLPSAKAMQAKRMP